MEFYIQDNSFIFRLNRFEERKKLIDLFFKRVDRIIEVENHKFKFRGPKQIECLLNQICTDMGLDIHFKLRKSEEDFVVKYNEYDLYFLDEVLLTFRKRYRFDRGCLNGGHARRGFLYS